MTLITYSSRVHFSDGITEEAIFAEFESSGIHRPILVGDFASLSPQVAERLIAALPARRLGSALDMPVDAPGAALASRIVQAFRDRRADALIAAGSSRALEIARQAHQGFRKVAGRGLPPMLFIPWVYGLPDPYDQTALSGREQRPELKTSTVIILDPTLTSDADRHATASGLATALSRAIEAFLSPAFHPPADGVALGAVRSAARALRTIDQRADIGWRRDAMAASFGATLAQEKGAGPVQALVYALSGHLKGPADGGDLRAVLLPRVLAVRNIPAEQARLLKEALALDGDALIAEGIAELLRPLGLPQRLSDVGLAETNLELAAINAEEMVHLWPRNATIMTGAKSLLAAAR